MELARKTTTADNRTGIQSDVSGTGFMRTSWDVELRREVYTVRRQSGLLGSRVEHRHVVIRNFLKSRQSARANDVLESITFVKLETVAIDHDRIREGRREPAELGVDQTEP